MSLCFFLWALKQVNAVVVVTILMTHMKNLSSWCYKDIFKLMSRTNETRYIEWNETCKCKCRLDASICNNTQRWNNDKCKSECKELINKGVCDKGFIWNPSNCECECDKSCYVEEYLDYENCKCRKKSVDKLVEEWTETVEEVKLTQITLAENENKDKCSLCTLYIVLFTMNVVLFIIIFFTIIVGIATLNFCLFSLVF